jgi:hypothetical protein
VAIHGFRQCLNGNRRIRANHPFFFTVGMPAVIASFVISTLAHFVVGASKSLVTTRSWWASGFEMTIVSVIEAGITYGLGRTFMAAPELGERPQKGTAHGRGGHSLKNVTYTPLPLAFRLRIMLQVTKEIYGEEDWNAERDSRADGERRVQRHDGSQESAGVQRCVKGVNRYARSPSSMT